MLSFLRVIAEAMAIDDRPVVIDFIVGADAQVWPMVAAGASNNEILAARDVVKQVFVDDKVKRYAVDLVAARHVGLTSPAASPTTSNPGVTLMTARAARRTLRASHSRAAPQAWASARAGGGSFTRPSRNAILLLPHPLTTSAATGAAAARRARTRQPPPG